jgi:hypothetical protein
MYTLDPQLRIRHKDDQPSEIEVLAVERQLAIQFPSAFRKFLMEHNVVGFGRWAICPTSLEHEHSTPVDLIATFGVSDKENCDIVEAQKYYDFRERVPCGIIAFGKCANHCMFCISVRSSDYGAIYLWHPALPWADGENERTEDCLRRVAGTFADFWTSLQPDPTFED